MIFGFDVDGVLCDISTSILYMTHLMTDEEAKTTEGHYYSERKPLLNPELFLAEGDKFYVLTSRPEHLRDITERFLNKYCPNYIELIMCGGDGWKPESGIPWADWNHEARLEKARMIMEVGCEVYIDDSPSNVTFYREHLDIPIIQYDGRFVK